jgi:hypothetical protein
MSGSVIPLDVREIRDPAGWNGMLLDLPAAHFEQGWEWGEVLAQAGWRLHRYAVSARGAVIGAIQIAARRLPGLGAVLYAPRGPVLETKDDDAWHGLMAAIETVRARTGAIFLRVSSGIRQDPGLHDALLERGFRHLPDDWTTWNVPRIVVTLDLGADEPELRQRIRKPTLRQAKSAERQGVVIRAATDEGDLATFHRFLVAMGNEKGYPVRGIERLRQLWQCYVAPGQGVLLLAEREGETLGGILGGRFGRWASFQCGAVRRDDTARPLHAGPLLYWEFIRWAKAQGCEAIDWGGSGTQYPPSPTDPGYGVYRFKMSFGCALSYASGYYDLVFAAQRYRACRLAERHVLPLAWRLRARCNE